MMTPDIFEPFADATCQTFKLLLDVDALAGAAEKLKACPDDNCRTEIAIGLTGDLSGEVLYRFPTETTLEIVKIMSGMEFTEIDEFVMSAMGEVANIISGNAVTGLSQKDITCDIMPPMILSDDPLRASETEYVFSTIVNTKIGDVEVLLMLKPDMIKSE